jgi:hypothetical protein
MIEKLTTEYSVVRTYQLLLPGYRGKAPFVDKQKIRQPNKSVLAQSAVVSAFGNDLNMFLMRFVYPKPSFILSFGI